MVSDVISFIPLSKTWYKAHFVEVAPGFTVKIIEV